MASLFVTPVSPFTPCSRPYPLLQALTIPVTDLPGFHATPSSLIPPPHSSLNSSNIVPPFPLQADSKVEQSKLFKLHKQLYTYLLYHEGKRQHLDSIALWSFKLPRESEVILEMHQNFTGLTIEHATIA